MDMNSRELLWLSTVLILSVGVALCTWANKKSNAEVSHLRLENIKLQNQVGFLEAENFNLREALEKKQ